MSNQNNNTPPNFWDWVSNSEDRNSPANGPWTNARTYPQFSQADFNPLAGWAGPIAGMPYRTRRGHPFPGPASHPAPPPPPPNYEERGREQQHGTHPPPPPPPQPEHELGDSADKEPMPPSPPASVPTGDEHHGRHSQHHHGHHPGHERRGRGGFGGRGWHHHRGHRAHSRGGNEHGHGPRGRGSSPSPFPFDLNELASQFLPHLFSNNNVINPFPTTNTRSAAKADGSFIPAVDVFDTPSKYLIHASIPGAKKSDIDVSWNAQTSSISISGVVHRPAGVDEEMLNTMVSDERQIGLFERSIKLDSEDVSVDIDGIGAKLEEGILVVTVPKLLPDEWTEVRKVDIE